MKLLTIRNFFHSETSWVFLDQLVFSASSFLTTIILARQLGIDSFGMFSAIILFLYLVLSASNALVMAPFQVLVSRVKQSGYYKASVFHMQWMVILLLCLLTYGVLYAGIPFLQQYRPYAFVICLLLTGFLLQDFYRRYFLATKQTKAAFLIDIVTSVLQIGILLLLSFLRKLNLENALLVMAATYIPSLLMGVSYFGKVNIAYRHFRVYLSKHMSAGRWLLLTAFLQWSSSNFLVAASGLFLGVRALGALRLSQTLFGVLNALLQVLDNYALPSAAQQYNKSAADLKVYLRSVTRQSLYFLLPIVILTIIFAKPVFQLAGGMQYVEYAYTLQGMAILYLVIFLGYPVRIAIRVYMMNRDFFIAYMASFVFSVLTARLFIQQWELYGVIIALIGNQLLMLVYWQWMLSRKNFFLWK